MKRHGGGQPPLFYLVSMKKISNTNYQINVNSKASGYDTRKTAFKRVKGRLPRKARPVRGLASKGRSGVPGQL
jgi:hypothetical protein